MYDNTTVWDGSKEFIDQHIQWNLASVFNEIEYD